MIAPLAASNTGSIAVTYNTPFTVQGGFPPVVVATSEDPNYYAVVQSGTDTGFTLISVRRDGTAVTATPLMSWIAIG